MDRETQFAGFAARVLHELDDAVRDMTGQDVSEQEFAGRLGFIIAQRAHDLACHVASFIPEREERMMRLGILSPQQVVDHVPDMVELSEAGLKG